MANELRRYKRVPLILEVRLESLSGKHTARTGDISLGGCYIESLGAVMPGEHLSFAVQLPTGRWISFRGQVTYRLPNMGFGVRFTNIPEIERNMLSQLIEFASYI
jgi:PilZ domain